MATEKRLIDAVRYSEVLERYINAPHVKVFGKYSDGMQLAINTCIELLNSQRTVDAVEVVRCKACKHRGSNLCPMETVELYPWFGTKNDAFCSYGERRTE